MCAYATPEDEVCLTEREARLWMCEVGRRLWQKNMVEANGGNLSYRLNDDTVLATPTMISKGFLEPDDLVILDMDGNQLSTGKRRKTSEILMHLTTFKHRPDVKACVHAHPPHATAFSVAKLDVPKCVMPEIEVLVGEVPIAPYETPGTQKFADTLLPYLKDFSMILLANHGAVAMGKGIMDAYWKLEVVEAYCTTICIARQLGDINQVTQAQIGEIFQIKQKLGIPDRRISDPVAARCDIPAPVPGNSSDLSRGGAGAYPSTPPPDSAGSAELVDRIAQAVIERLRRGQ